MKPGVTPACDRQEAGRTVTTPDTGVKADSVIPGGIIQKSHPVWREELRLGRGLHLTHRRGHLEDGQIHGNHDASDDDSQEDHQERL